MTLPVTDFPAWSATTNYTTGPDVGTPTKVAPSAGEIAEGFVPETAAVPQYVNYLFANIKQHITYLRGLTAEALTWTAAQIFSNTATFNGAVTMTSTVTTSFELGYAIPKTCRVMVPPTEFEAIEGGIWLYAPNTGGASVWVSTPTVTPELLVGHVRVPNEATVTGCQVSVFSNNTADTGEVKFWRVRVDHTTGAPTYLQIGATATFDYVGGYEVKTAGAVSVLFAETDFLAIEIATGTAGAGSLQLVAAEIQYSEVRATGSN
jgi:hypothetical protein